MNVSDALAEAAKRLEAGGVAEPRREAASLLAFALGRDRTFLIAHPEYEPNPDESARYSSFVSRRAGREPYQYIVGKQEFYGLDFEVTRDVLIPRPETEILVEEAIKRLDALPSPRFLEIGVGSGCISVSVLKNVASASAVVVDNSAAALAVAARNADRHDVADRIELRVSDLYSDVSGERFDAVLSNPPYVPAADIASLQPEVRGFEPIGALTDGADGLSIIRQIVSRSPDFLLPGGYLLIEIGFGQAESVKKMYDPEIWRSVELIDDLQRIPRTVVASLW